MITAHKTVFHFNLQELTNRCWAIPCQFSGSGQVTSPILLKFYSNCHCPIWWTSAKFEWNLSRNGMIIKIFTWGCLISTIFHHTIVIQAGIATSQIHY